MCFNKVSTKTITCLTIGQLTLQVFSALVITHTLMTCSAKHSNSTNFEESQSNSTFSESERMYLENEIALFVPVVTPTIILASFFFCIKHARNCIWWIVSVITLIHLSVSSGMAYNSCLRKNFFESRVFSTIATYDVLWIIFFIFLICGSFNNNSRVEQDNSPELTQIIIKPDENQQCSHSLH